MNFGVFKFGPEVRFRLLEFTKVSRKPSNHRTHSFLKKIPPGLTPLGFNPTPHFRSCSCALPTSVGVKLPKYQVFHGFWPQSVKTLQLIDNVIIYICYTRLIPKSTLFHWEPLLMVIER